MMQQPVETVSSVRAARTGCIVIVLILATPSLAQPPLPKPLSNLPKSLVPIAVFGEDTRKPIPQSHAFLKDQIGVLVIGESSFCTAFCVANDVIATASHCLLGTDQSPGPDLERVEFRTGAQYQKASRLAGKTRRAIHEQMSTGTALLHVTPPIAAAADWGLVRLDAAVCTAGGLALSEGNRDSVEKMSEIGAVYQVAMHRDIASGSLMMDAECHVARVFKDAGEETIAQDFSNPGAILMHTCDTGAGSSGSPMLIDTPWGPQVVGINVGTYVLSRTATSTSSQAGGESMKSEPIANTAVSVEAFRTALESYTIQTSSIRWTRGKP